jgi:hypothetical protein
METFMIITLYILSALIIGFQLFMTQSKTKGTLFWNMPIARKVSLWFVLAEIPYCIIAPFLITPPLWTAPLCGVYTLGYIALSAWLQGKHDKKHSHDKGNPGKEDVGGL